MIVITKGILGARYSDVRGADWRAETSRCQGGSAERPDDSEDPPSGGQTIPDAEFCSLTERHSRLHDQEVTAVSTPHSTAPPHPPTGAQGSSRHHGHQPRQQPQGQQRDAHPQSSPEHPPRPRCLDRTRQPLLGGTHGAVSTATDHHAGAIDIKGVIDKPAAAEKAGSQAEGHEHLTGSAGIERRQLQIPAQVRNTGRHAVVDRRLIGRQFADRSADQWEHFLVAGHEPRSQHYATLRPPDSSRRAESLEHRSTCIAGSSGRSAPGAVLRARDWPAGRGPESRGVAAWRFPSPQRGTLKGSRQRRLTFASGIRCVARSFASTP